MGIFWTLNEDMAKVYFNKKERRYETYFTAKYNFPKKKEIVDYQKTFERNFANDLQEEEIILLKNKKIFVLSINIYDTKKETISEIKINKLLRI